MLVCGGGSSGPSGPSITSFTAGKSTIFQGTGTTLTAVFTNGTGSIDQGVGAVSSGVPVNTGNLTATTTFTLTVTGNGGSPVTQTTTVTVDPNLVGPISAPTFATTGATGLVASVPAQPGASYAWTVTGGTLTAGAGTNSITFTAGATGTLALQCILSNGAGSATVTANVSLVAAPLSILTAPATVIADQTGIAISVPAQAGCTYAWTVTGGTITAGDGTNAITVTAANVATIQVQCVVTNQAGTPATSTFSITVNQPPAPVATITTPAFATVGSTGLSASVPSQAGVTYAWTLAGGTITAGNGTNAITYSVGSGTSAQLQCIVTNVVSVQATGTATVTLVAAPVPPVITAPAAVTAGQTGISASVPAQLNCTYAWTVTGGTVTAGAGTSAITLTAGAAGTMQIQCVVTNPAGATASGSVTVPVDPVPVATITAPAFATTGSAGLTATVASQAGDSYAWTLTGGTITAGAGTSAITFSVGSGASAQLQCVVTNQANGQTTGNATVTLVPAPATPVITAPASVNAGQTGNAASVPTQANCTYAWTVTGGTVTGGVNTNAITFTAGIGASLQLQCVVANQAGTTATGTLTVPVNPAPTPVATITAPSIATVGATGLAASVPTQSGDTYAWTLTGGTVTAGAGTSAITFTAGTGASVQLQCVVTNIASVQATGTFTTNLVAAPITPVISAPSSVAANTPGIAVSVPPQSNCTYTWTVTGGTVTAGSGTNAITVTAGAAGTMQIQCVVANQANTTATGTFTVTVNPDATPVATITAPTYATAGSTGLSASVPSQTGDTYVWTVTGGTLTSGAGTNAITFTAGTGSTLQLQCVVTNLASVQATGTFTVTVVPTPATPVITAPASVNAGQTGIVASVPAQAGCTYLWTVTGGTISAGAGTASITLSAGVGATLQLQCVVSNQAGASATGSLTVTIIPAAGPVANITGPTYATVGTTGLTASVPTQSGDTYAWTLTGGTITAGAGTSAITFSVGSGASAQLQCVVTNIASVSATGNLAITLVPAPITPVITAPASVTAGTTGIAASVPAQANCTYTWTVTGGTVTAGAGTNVITITAGTGSSMQLQCVVANQANTTATGSLSVTINPAPTPIANITGPAYATAGGTGLTASVPSQANCTYAWTVTGGTLTSGSGTNAITFSAGTGASVQLQCMVTNQASVSATGTLMVTVVPAPALPVISAPANVTAGQAGISASVPAQANCAYAWTVTGGTLTAGAGTNTITVTAGTGASIQLQCVVANQAGTTATGNATITISAAPVATITGPANATAGAAGLTASVPSQPGFTYVWTIIGGSISAGAGTNAITFAAGTGATVQLQCVVSNPGATSSATGTLTVNVYAAPTVPAITAATPVTTGQTNCYAYISAQGSDSYAWSITGGTITSGATGSYVYFTAGAVGTLQLTCVVSNPAGATASGSQNVSVVAAPIVPVITAPSTGYSSYYGYTASVPAQAGVTFAWTISGGVIVTGANTSSITFNTLAGTSLTLQCVATNAAGTASAAGAATMTLTPAPAGVTVVPTSGALNARGTLQILATVTGQTNTGVTWAVTEGLSGGSVSPTGLYTAPAMAGTYHVVATSLAQSSLTATCTVTVSALGVTVSPATASLLTGATQTFTATVAGGGSGNVAWSVLEGAAGGSVTGSGAYTAPAAAGIYHVLATSSDDPSRSAVATLTVSNPLAVTVQPASATVAAGAVQAFLAGVTGSANTAVTWSVVETGGGKVSAGGTYTAPVVAGTYHVKATTVATPAQSSTATITVPVALSVTPATAFVQPMGTQQFSATVSGALNQAVTWTVVESGGGSVAAGTGLYTAPATPGTYHLTATSAADGTKSQTVTVTVNGGIAVQVTPAGQQIGVGSSLQMTAHVLGSTQGVVWTVQEAAGGTISTSGLYSAPAQAGTFHVVATSVENPAKTSVTPVVVYTAPAIQSFTVSSPNVPFGSNVQLNVNFNYGQGFVDHGVGAVVTGNIYTTQPLTETTTFTLTVLGSANQAVSAQVTVAVQASNQNGASVLTPHQPNFARYNHTATNLADGTVLVAGGYVANNPSSTAEVYNPSTGTFTQTAGNLNSARFGHAAVLLPDNTVLVVGGTGYTGSSYTILASAEIYNPATRKFTPLVNQMTTPRSQPGAILMNTGQVLIAGGTYNGNLDTAEIYDPVAKTFTATASMVPAYANEQAGYWGGLVTLALLPDNRVLTTMAGGYGGMEIFDPSTNLFTLVPDSANYVNEAVTSSVLLNGQVFLFGSAGEGAVQDWLYDPASQTFRNSIAVNLPQGQYLTVPLPTGRVMMAGGYTTMTDAQGVSRYAYLQTQTYDPATDQVYLSGTLLGNRDTTSTANVVDSSGTVLLVGGSSAPSTAELYTPAITPTPVNPVVTPAVAIFKATPNQVQTGGTSVLYAVFPTTGGMTASIDQGIGPVQSGVPVTTGPITGTTRFTLTVKNSYGDQVQSALVVALDNDQRGSMSLASPMVEPRSNLSATQLASGTVLAAGGADRWNYTSALVEAFNPYSQAFSVLGYLAQARQNHSATLLMDGKVLFVGGFATVGNETTTSSPLASAELFDPASGTSTATGSLASGPESGHAAVSLGGTPGQEKVLIVGNGSLVMEIYSELTGTFAAVNTSAVTGGVFMGQAYPLPGGSFLLPAWTPDPNYYYSPTFLSYGTTTFWVFNPATLAFTPVAPSLQVLNYSTSSGAFLGGLPLPDGRVLLGWDLVPFQIYDPATGAITVLGGTPNYSHASSYGSFGTQSTYAGALMAQLGNGQVLLAGGGGGNYNTTEVYDLPTGVCFPTAPLEFSRYAPQANATLLQGGNPSQGANPLAGEVLFMGSSNPAELYLARNAVASPAPVVTRLTASPSLIAIGQTAQLTAFFSGGTGAIDQGVGAVTSGTPVVVGPLPGTTVFTLTVTNITGEKVQASVPVFVQTPQAGAGVSAGLGAMAMAHVSAPTAMLGNGQVGVFGGSNGNSSSIQTENLVEAFNPATGTFNGIGSMQLPHPYGAATTLLNGKVLVTGGYWLSLTSGTYTYSGQAELFDPATGLAALTGSLTLGPRYNHGSLRLADGRVLIHGGAGAGAATGAGEIFNPATGAFTATASLGGGSHSVLLGNGKVLLDNPTQSGTNGAFTLYDPSANTATTLYLPGFNSQTYQYTYIQTPLCRLADGRVLILATSYSPNYQLVAYLYDPASNQITESRAQPLQPYRQYGLTTLLPSGQILLSGGVLTTNSAAVLPAEVYDPATDAFYPGGSLLNAYRSDANCAAYLLPSGSPLAGEVLFLNPAAGAAELYLQLAAAPAAPPVLTGFSASPALVAPGQSSTLTATFSGGTAAITPGLGAVVSGAGVSTGSLVANTTYTLTVTNATGQSVTASVTVLVDGSSLGAATIMPGLPLVPNNPQINGILGSSATPLPDGRVVLTGGSPDSFGYAFSGTAEVFAFDPATSLFNHLGFLLQGRYGHMAVYLPASGRILVAGGNFVGGNGLSSVELFDPGTGTATSLASLTGYGAMAAGFALPGGKVLALEQSGGVELYDPAANHWTSLGSNGTIPAGAAALLANGQVFYVGSSPLQGFLVNPTAGTVANLGILALDHGGNPGVTRLGNGQVVITGGIGAEVYDPVSNLITSAAGHPVQYRAGHLATLIAGNRVLLAGGMDASSKPVLATEIYDPLSQSFAPAAALPLALSTTYGSAASTILGASPLAGDILYTSANGTPYAELFAPPAAQAPGSAIQAFEATPTRVSSGGSVTLNVTYAGSGATIDQGIGPVARGAQVSTPALTATTTFTLTVQGDDGSTSTAQVVVPVAPATSGVLYPVPAAPRFPDRSGQTATLLANGQVLLAGGTSSNVYNSGLTGTTVELFNPVTGQFTSFGNALRAARNFASATLLPSGLVLITGGNPTANDELFNPATGTSTYSTGTDGAYYPYGAILLPSGQVVVVSSYNAPNIYNPSQDAFTAGPSYPAGVASILAGGSVLLSDGRVALSDGARIFIFDPVALTYTTPVAFPATLSYTQLVLLPSGKVLCQGTGSGSSAGTYLFDPSTGSVNPTTGAMLEPRYANLAVPLQDGRVLLAGGSDANTNQATVTTEIFDPGTGLFTADVPLAAQRNSTYSTATVLPDGRVFLAGAVNTATGFDEIYQPGAAPVTAPAILTSPASQSILAGQTANFSVSASGTAPLSYLWTVNGNRAGASAPTLAVATTDTSLNGATVLVTVSNPAGSAISNPATLTVAAANPLAVTPATASLTYGQSQAFAATGLAPGAFTWSVDGGIAHGSITSAGVYTAPSAAGAFTVRATDNSNSSNTATATVTVTAPVAIQIAPAAQTLLTGQAFAFSATVSNATNTSVLWTVVGGSASGVVDGSGNYTAPATPGSYVLIATSVQDPTKSSIAAITVKAPVSVSVAPATAAASTGGQVVFTATVLNATNTGVTWSVVGGNGNGTINTFGYYTAPATPGTYTVKATSKADVTKSATATVNVSQSTAISLNPAGPLVVAPGAAQPITATMAGDPQGLGVTWTVTGSGTVSNTSTTSTTFTAPYQPGTYVVTATANANPAVTANVTVQVPIVLSVSPATLSIGLGGQATLNANLAGGIPASQVTWAALHGTFAATGTSSAAGSQVTYVAPASGTADTVTVTSTVDNTRTATCAVTLTSTAVVTVLPAAGTVPSGGSLQFTALANGAPPALGSTVSWSVGGVPGGNASLGTITNAGLYFPPASGTLAATPVTATVNAQTGNATVTVVAAWTPVLAVSPAGGSCNNGDHVTLTVTGAPGDASYQWTLNGTPFHNAAGAIYDIAAADNLDTGAYAVRVTDPAYPAGLSTGTVQVTVQPEKVTNPPGPLQFPGIVKTLIIQQSPWNYYWQIVNVSGSSSVTLTAAMTGKQAYSRGSLALQNGAPLDFFLDPDTAHSGANPKVYVLTQAPEQLLRYDVNTIQNPANTTTTATTAWAPELAVTLPAGSGPAQVNGDGAYLYVSLKASGQVAVIPVGSTTPGLASFAPGSQPDGMAPLSGSLYVALAGQDRVGIVTPASLATSIPAGWNIPQGSQPTNIMADQAGNLLVSCSGSSTVLVINPSTSGGIVHAVVGTAGKVASRITADRRQALAADTGAAAGSLLGTPTKMITGGDGRIWVLQPNLGRALILDPLNNYASSFQPFSTNFGNPQGITTDANGDLWVSETNLGLTHVLWTTPKPNAVRMWPDGGVGANRGTALILPVGGRYQFLASYNGASSGISFAVTGGTAGGSIDSSTGIYTAPAFLSGSSTSATDTVTATYTGSPSSSFSVTVEVVTNESYAVTTPSSALTGRLDPTATLLGDGATALITGGFDSAGNRLYSAETYNLLTGTRTLLSSGLAPFSYDPNPTLGAQALLVTKGTGAGQVVVVQAGNGTLQVFNPATSQFGPVVAMLHPRVAPEVAELADGRILIAGGNILATALDGTVAQPDLTAELFDPALYAQSLPAQTLYTGMINRHAGGRATTLSSGKVLITGDLTAFAATSQNAEVFDPAAGAFTAVGSLQTPRGSHHTTLLKDGRVLVSGGGFSAWEVQTQSHLEIFDEAAGGFTSGGYTTRPLGYHSADLLPDGKVLLIYAGGTEVYDPLLGISSLVSTQGADAHATIPWVPPSQGVNYETVHAVGGLAPGSTALSGTDDVFYYILPDHFMTNFLSISVPAYVTLGQGTWTAHIPYWLGINYMWASGAFSPLSPLSGNSLDFQGTTGGALTLSCAMTNVPGLPPSVSTTGDYTATATIQVVPPPAIASFAATPPETAPTLAGATPTFPTITFNWQASNAVYVTIYSADADAPLVFPAGPVNVTDLQSYVYQGNGTELSVGSHTFVLTAVNAAGTAVTAEATVVVHLPPPAITVFSANPANSTTGPVSPVLTWNVVNWNVQNTTVIITATYPDGSHASFPQSILTGSGATLTDQGPGGTGLPLGQTTYVLTATNPTATVTTTLKYMVQAPVTLSAITLNPNTSPVAAGTPVTLSWTGTDGADPSHYTLTLVVTGPSGAGTFPLTDGTSSYLFTPTVAGSYSFQLTATNSIGVPATSNASIQVQAPPTLSAITLNSGSSVAVGTPETMSWTGNDGGDSGHFSLVLVITGPSGPQTITLGDFSTSYSYYPSVAGSYTVQLTAANSIGSPVVSNSSFTAF